MRYLNLSSILNPWHLALTVFFVVMAMHAGQPRPDFIRGHIEVHPDPFKKTISGQVHYSLIAEQPLDSIALDAQSMRYQKVELNGSPVQFKATSARLVLQGPLPAGEHELLISYEASPAQALYFIGWEDDIEGNEQIWTQGQGKGSSHWVPVVERMDEKVEFDLSVRMDKTYQVIANGTLSDKTMEDGLVRWDFNMDHPMSSYLLAFAVGRFDHLEDASSSGVPLQLYFPAGELEKARWTYRFSREIFDFLEKEIGLPYPWGDYKQVPVSDFLYAGMENTGATFFADRYFVDSIGFQDENYVNINAHELAHQWFGNLVTEKDASHHWLHEGFATFYAYQAEAWLMGKTPVYWNLYDSAMALSEMDAEGQGESLIDPKASSLTFYEKGAWAFLILQEEVGEVAFKKGVQEYLSTYSFGSATVEDFLKVMQVASGKSLSDFRQTWLEASTFPQETALAYLSGRDPSIKAFLELREQEESDAGIDSTLLKAAWDAHMVPEYREHLIHAYRDLVSRPFLEQMFETCDLPVCKALLSTTPELEAWMIPPVTAWLDAPSYDLREAALFRLWVADPPGRQLYLQRLAENGSLSDIGLQQLWWLLSAFTDPQTDPGVKQTYLEALRRTTGPGYSWEIRQNGFAMLYEVRGLDTQNVRDLILSTEHHSWQYRKFARDLFERILEETENREALWGIIRSFPRAAFGFVYAKMEES